MLAVIYAQTYFPIRRSSIIARVFVVAVVALVALSLNGMFSGSLPPSSPGPSVCDPAPIDLPHNDTPDTPSQLPRQFVASMTATAADVALGCSAPGPKHNTR